MEKPDLIYKYQSPCEQSFQNLEAHSFYFGSPREFNDPYDCALYPSLAEPTDSEARAYRSRYTQPGVPERVRREFLEISNDDLKAKIIEIVKRAVDERIDAFLKNNGVTCFSEDNNNLLMWAHYGRKYRGFCLEFSTEYEPFKKMAEVTYDDLIPTINAVSILNGDDSFITQLYRTKSSSWNYEKEWRVIHNEVGTLYGYETSALKAIYLGPDISPESSNKLALIVSRWEPAVTLWKGRLSKERFAVVFEKAI